MSVATIPYVKALSAPCTDQQVFAVEGHYGKVVRVDGVRSLLLQHVDADDGPGGKVRVVQPVPSKSEYKNVPRVVQRFIDELDFYDEED